MLMDLQIGVGGREGGEDVRGDEVNRLGRRWECDLEWEYESRFEEKFYRSA